MRAVPGRSSWAWGRTGPAWVLPEASEGAGQPGGLLAFHPWEPQALPDLSAGPECARCEVRGPAPLGPQLLSRGPPTSRPSCLWSPRGGSSPGHTQLMLKEGRHNAGPMAGGNQGTGGSDCDQTSLRGAESARVWPHPQGRPGGAGGAGQWPGGASLCLVSWAPPRHLALQLLLLMGEAEAPRPVAWGSIRFPLPQSVPPGRTHPPAAWTSALGEEAETLWAPRALAQPPIRGR